MTNLRPIDITFELVNVGLESHRIAVDALSVEVAKIDETPLANLPVKITFSGRGGMPDRRYVSASLVLPMQEEERRRNIRGYVNRIVEAEEVWFEEVRKQIGQIDPERRAMIERFVERYREKWFSDAENGNFEKVFGTVYRDNRVGTFGMICRYQPDEDVGLEGGGLVSRPVRFRVRNDGSFFDSLTDSPESQTATAVAEWLRLLEPHDDLDK